jgi:hypothetical protein
MALCVVPALGTRCASLAGPAVYVFRRYPLASKPDSTLPTTLSVRGYSFSRPAPRQHQSDKEPLPTCDGFQLYVLDHLPAGFNRDSLSMSPIEFELLLNRSATPALVVYYEYRLPLRTRDPSTPDGAAQAARMAREEAAMDSAADEVARKVIGGAVRIESFAPADTERTQSPEARRDRCRIELSRARG